MNREETDAMDRRISARMLGYGERPLTAHEEDQVTRHVEYMKEIERASVARIEATDPGWMQKHCPNWSG